MWVVVPELKLDEKTIGDGLKSQKRLLWPSRPLVLRMIYYYPTTLLPYYDPTLIHEFYDRIGA